MDMIIHYWTSLVVILLTLAGVAIGRYPGLRMNRATIVLVGSTALIILGAISLDQAYQAIDLNTIVLLFSMMVLNINLRLAGFFGLVVHRVARFAKNTKQLLFLVIMSSGMLSALFLNDTVVIMFTPLVLEMTTALKRNPIPYLMGLATAANVGSTATIIGNPQNMLIGMASGISFISFAWYLTPVAIAGLLVVYAVIITVYRDEFNGQKLNYQISDRPRIFKPLLYKSTIALALMLAAFVVGAKIPLAALGAASLLLITRRIKPQRVFGELDWGLLVFFSGLFIVTHAIETSGLGVYLFDQARPLLDQGLAPLTIVSALLSNIISNVPAVLLFRPIMGSLADPNIAWLTLAMATTFAGNLTLLGSVANLIVAETAKSRGIHLSFQEYLKAGLPITIITLTIGVFWFNFIK
ncbi:MAG: anion transporter [candidate division KSB1 bacterium]|nr:anion transporter [candidate division KSB1 bacterium]MDZ7334606.1 anion transporter [candidate division KSB1 bacterium]MDZ7356586.1 anion transporter [candidate division KSB1 bacterium]MDZ7376128.1 anion transporter [candidate division KSB1 bacterium]MDZ7399903.1 anion transporter [candidate division KSB1 bacterium]